MEYSIVLLVTCLIIYIFFSPFFIEEKIEDYDISKAVLIDYFIINTDSGFPNYYLIYKFEDNSIIEFKVSSEQYYKNLEGS